MADKTYTKRVFKYEHHTWDDPGEQYSLEDIKNHLAAIHPAIRQAEIKQDTKDGILTVTFVKKATTKGGYAGPVGTFRPGYFSLPGTLADPIAHLWAMNVKLQFNLTDAECAIDALDHELRTAISLVDRLQDTLVKATGTEHWDLLTEAADFLAGLIVSDKYGVMFKDDATDDDSA